MLALVGGVCQIHSLGHLASRINWMWTCLDVVVKRRTNILLLEIEHWRSSPYPCIVFSWKW